ncbi:SRPBCC family protein [Planococcus sp. APC 4015]|nr:SRPBCC family protein [Planococcus sp. APC 4015]
MPSSFVVVTEAACDAAVLFDLSLNVDVHLGSMKEAGEQAIDGVVTGAIGLGEKVTWRARHFGVWFTMTSEISELDRPIRFVDRPVRGPFRSFEHEHLFEQRGEATRMSDTISLSSPIFGRAVEKVILVPYLRRLVRRRNRYLLAQLSGARTGTDEAAALSPREAALDELTYARPLWTRREPAAKIAVDAAVAGLLAGLDNGPLRELAGLPLTTGPFELGQLLDETLTALDPNYPSMTESDATILTVRRYALRYAHGTLTARQLSAWAHDTIGHDGPPVTHPIVNLDDDLDLERSGVGRGTVDSDAIIRGCLRSTSPVAARFRPHVPEVP